MNNCVGFANYRYFFLFVWWLLVSSVYAVSMLLPLKSQSSLPNDGITANSKRHDCSPRFLLCMRPCAGLDDGCRDS